MKKIYAVLFTLVSSMTALAAHAAGGDFYGGAGYNINTFASGARIFGGYTILKDKWELAGRPVSIAVEGTYLDIGTGSINTFVKDHETGLFATAVGRMRVADNLDVFAQAGFGQVQAKLTDNFYGTSTTYTGTAPIVGVGATYTFMPHVGVRTDLERYTGEYESAVVLAASVVATF